MYLANECWENVKYVHCVVCCAVREQKRERDGQMENRFLDALHFDASYGMFVHLIVKDNISIRYAHESVV